MVCKKEENSYFSETTFLTGEKQNGMFNKCLLKWRSEKISVENVEFATEEFEFATEYWINLRHFRFWVIAVLNNPPTKTQWQ